MSRPLVLIVGMLTTKDCAGFLRNFTGLARRVIAVPVPGAEKGLPRRGGRRCRARHRHSGRRAATISTRRSTPSRKLDLDPPPRILITGSLYLAGEVLRAERHAAHVTAFEERAKRPGGINADDSTPPCRGSSPHSGEAFQQLHQIAFFCSTCSIVHCSRRLVRPPAQQPRAVAEAVAGEMVVADLDDELRLERLPFGRALGRPAARAARRVAGEAGRRDQLFQLRGQRRLFLGARSPR